MDPKKMTPMHKVLADMGRAANQGRARRFTKKPIVEVDALKVGGPRIEDAQPPGGPEGMGDKTMPPTPGAEAHGMTPAELEELVEGLQH